MPGETPQNLFARVASYFSDDAAHAQRIYDWAKEPKELITNGEEK